MMKQGSIIVNTSRGAIVDTTALVEALKAGKFAGVALDVYEKEENIRIKSEKGYDYTVSEISKTEHKVSVNCAEKGISVYLITENIPYEETSGLWQVTAYRIDK